MTRAFIIQLSINSPEEIPSILSELTTILEPHFGDIKVDVWNSPDTSPDALSSPVTFPNF